MGGGYYPSPLKTTSLAAYYPYDFNAPMAYTELTSGLGYRNKNFFFDFGFSWLSHTEDYYLYTININNNPSASMADLKQNEFRFLTTMGIRF